MGLAEMAASAGISYEVLAWTAEWYFRAETLEPANAVIVNYHHELRFAQVSGTGTLSSPDGQRCRLVPRPAAWRAAPARSRAASTRSRSRPRRAAHVAVTARQEVFASVQPGQQEGGAGRRPARRGRAGRRIRRRRGFRERRSLAGHLLAGLVSGQAGQGPGEGAGQRYLPVQPGEREDPPDLVPAGDHVQAAAAGRGLPGRGGQHA
jgi:Tn3 transposase DDE domain